MKDRNQQIDRYLDGSLDTNEIKDLFAWLAESPQNAEVFARQSLLDQHLTELLDGGFMKPLETTLDKSSKPETVQIKVRSWRRFQRLVWAGGLAASFLIISLLIVSFILSGKIADLRDDLEIAQRRNVSTAQAEETTTINFYLKEHQDTIARYASHDLATSQPIQMQINQDDILYFEFIGNRSEFMHPGMIVRRPSYQGQINTSQTPAISNGHTLTLPEAQEAANFDLVSPSWLHPYYKLGQIRIIEGRDALQLLYTDGINSVSLFEQPLDGESQLSPQDFREYAVYNNQGEGGGAILAWRDDTLSYVLIGNIEMSKLMDMAQSISAGK